MDDQSGMSGFVRPDANGRMECYDFDAVKVFFYHDCDEATTRQAFDQLSPAPTEFLLQPVHLPAFWHANLPRSYIQCLDDRALPKAISDHTAKRLGVEPLTIPGSHSPFLSRPRALANLLVHATGTYPTGTPQPH